MDERIGNHAIGDVLIDGSKIVEVAARIDVAPPNHAPGAESSRSWTAPRLDRAQTRRPSFRECLLS
jgi:hypothetical protein